MWRHLKCVTPAVLKNLVDAIGYDVEALDGFDRLACVHRKLADLPHVRLTASSAFGLRTQSIRPGARSGEV